MLAEHPQWTLSEQLQQPGSLKEQQYLREQQSLGEQQHLTTPLRRTGVECRHWVLSERWSLQQQRRGNLDVHRYLKGQQHL